MSFPTYAEYARIDNRFVENVPVHWRVCKVAHVFAEIGSGTTPKSDIAEYYDGGTIPWINSGDLNDGILDECTPRQVTKKALEDHSTLRLYPAGSLVFAMYGATIGKLGMLAYPATVNQACCVFTGSSQITLAFLFYILLGLRPQILSLATGGGQTNVSQEILRSLRVPFPPAAEQHAIASFLDRETAKIDALMAEQRRLIELLKEKQQAVISQAVTKGLDPNVRMKASGMEWLGDVPEHWEVGPLKRFWTVMDCKHVTAEFVDNGIPLASIREVQSKWVELSEAKCTTERFYQLLTEGGRMPCTGDLILSRNATVGEIAQVGRSTPRFAMGQDVCLLRKRDLRASSDHWQHVIKSNRVGEQMAALMVGATFKRLNVDEIRNLIVLSPPASEQESIAEFLNCETAIVNSLIAEASRAIELLQERRTALISAAVTGKIDVRALASQEAA